MPNISKTISIDMETNGLLEEIARQYGKSQSCVIRELIASEAKMLKIKNDR